MTPMGVSWRSSARGIWIVLGVAARNIVRQPRRTIAGVAAITFGVVALILSAGFIEWSNWALRETTIHSGLGHIQIVRNGYRESGLADPFAYLLPEHSQEQRAVEALPGIVSVAPRLVFSGLISLGETTLSFIADGVDPAREAGLDSSVMIVAGEPLAADDPEGITIGAGLAANLGAKVGDRVVVLANTNPAGSTRSKHESVACSLQ